MWDTGGAFSIHTGNSIGPGAWHLGTGIDATTRVCAPLLGCATFGARVGAETSGNFGVNYDVKLNGGSLDLRYPIAATFTVPNPGVPFTGADFTIGSTWALQPGGLRYIAANGATLLGPGATLQTHGPQVEAFVDLLAQFHAFAGAQLCVVVCGGPAFAPPDINAGGELVAINRGGDGQVRLGGTPVGPNGNFSVLGNLVTGHLAVPNLDATAAVAGSDLNTAKTSLVAGVNANLAQIAANAVGFPLPLQGSFAGIGYNLLQADAGVALEIAQALGFAPRPQATLLFSSPVQQRFGNGSYGAATTTISFALGDSITLKAPGESALGVIPTLSLGDGNNVSNHTDLKVTGNVGVKALGVDIFGLRLGPLFNENASTGQLGSIPVRENHFHLNVAPVVARPFNLIFNPLDIDTNVSCAAINGCVFDIFNSIDSGSQDPFAPDFIVRVGCRLIRGVFLSCNSDDPEAAIVVLTAALADTPDGNGLFLSELAGLQFVDLSSPAGSSDGEAAALLERLGFSDISSAFVVPQGDPLPPEASVPTPEPGTLSLAGIGILVLAGLRRRRSPEAAVQSCGRSGGHEDVVFESADCGIRIAHCDAVWRPVIQHGVSLIEPTFADSPCDLAGLPVKVGMFLQTARE